MLGNGDGTFQSVQTYVGGTSPVVADVNGDGKLDLIVSTACGNPPLCSKGGVGVLLGNGDGTFQSMVTYSSGGYIDLKVLVADVNRDGRSDLLVLNASRTANDSQGKIGVLLGQGDGTFSAVQSVYLENGSGASIAAGDVNGNGKVDLVAVANGFSNNSSTEVLLNNFFWSTTTSLTSSPNPSQSGQLVTLTANVVTTGSIAPTGAVAFKNGGTVIGKVTLSDGIAVFMTSKLPIGDLSLTARYQGDTNSAKSTSPVVIQVVNP